MADEVDLRFKCTVFYLFEVLSVGLFLPFCLCFPAFLDEVEFNRLISSLATRGNHSAYLIDLWPMGQLHLLEPIFLYLSLLLYDIQVVLLELSLVVEPPSDVLVYSTNLLPL